MYTETTGDICDIESHFTFILAVSLYNRIDRLRLTLITPFDEVDTSQSIHKQVCRQFEFSHFGIPIETHWWGNTVRSSCTTIFIACELSRIQKNQH